MKEATTEKGENTKRVIERIFENSEIEYIHIHNSSPGCYNCEVQRID
jgi:transcriptional regulator